MVSCTEESNLRRRRAGPMLYQLSCIPTLSAVAAGLLLFFFFFMTQYPQFYSTACQHNFITVRCRKHHRVHVSAMLIGQTKERLFVSVKLTKGTGGHDGSHFIHFIVDVVVVVIVGGGGGRYFDYPLGVATVSLVLLLLFAVLVCFSYHRLFEEVLCGCVCV